MRRALVMSSFVAKGTVGLQATLPALTATGVETISVPTVVLSNHPGFKACAGTAIACETLHAMLDALDVNGWLSSIDTIFTGYLPSAEHVSVARAAVERVKAASPAALYLADPVLGDDPSGLYVSRETAIAVRDLLLPLATIATPNRFELSWLAGRDVTDRETAVAAARSIGVPLVAATSISSGDEHLENLLISTTKTCVETVQRLSKAPHGTGDYFAGVLLSELLHGAPHPGALATATRQTERLVVASQHSDDLVFADTGK